MIRGKAIFLLFVMLLAAGLLISCSSSGGGGGGSSHAAYVTVPQNNQVMGFHINDTSGKLNPISGSPFASGTSPAAVCVHPSNQFAYVANQAEGDVSLFTIDSGGVLSEVMPRASTGLNPTALATTISIRR